jgi:hypothetical protein
MSENTRNFINGVWAQEKVFNDGGSIIKLSILPEKFIESIKSLKPDAEGFARIVISKSRNPKPNSSHYLYEDDFVPNKTLGPKTVTSKIETKTTSKKTDKDQPLF